MEDMKKILVVEDEAIHAMFLKIILRDNGFECTGTEATGEGAIACVEKVSPDLILMDITLRNSIDGIAVATILREKYNFPIIFVSGYNDEKTLNRINTIANTWKLSKPTEEIKLINLINEVLAH
jgi:CheY-like chemotaxis protein